MVGAGRAVASAVLLLAVGAAVAFALSTGETPEEPQGPDIELAEPQVRREIPEDVVVPVLVYHHVRPEEPNATADERAYTVTPQEFESHLRYLRDSGFTGILLKDVEAALVSGQPLPERPVAITFDDGRDSQYSAAFPLLLEYGFTAGFYPFTNAIGRPGYLTWDQLAEMAAAGMDIGSHTVFHPYLTKSDDDELESEVARSREVLEQNLDVTVTVLTHPFGLSDGRTRDATAEAGYLVGRGLRHDMTHDASELMDLGSYIVTGPLSQLKSILGE